MATPDGAWHPVAPHVEFSPASVTKFSGRIARFDKLRSKWRWEACAHSHPKKADAVECGRVVAEAKNRLE